MIHSENQYKMLEEQLKKLQRENELKEKEIKLLKKQNKQQEEIIHDLDKNNYRVQCEALKQENSELKKKLQIYEEKFELARISLGKNSSNSSKPSSTDGIKKVVQNNRVKSGRKPGREKGHKKSSPTVSTNPDEQVMVSKVATCTCGCKTEEQEEIARDVVTIKIITYTKQYVGKKTKCPRCNKEYIPKFPEGVNNPVNYDEKIKAIMVYLNAYCNVSNQRNVNFLSFLTNNKLKISHGTVYSTLKQFSKASAKVLQDMKEEILKSPVINEDETPIAVNGKLMSTIGIFTDKISILEAFETKKLESYKEMGILDRYIGTVCHDHNSIHQSFPQFKDAECNAHILRYCKGEYEVHKRESIKDFMDYLLELKENVEKAKLEGKTKVSDIEYENYKKIYLEKLDNWDKEHLAKADKNRQEYYKSEIRLKKRLREYAEDHLRFLTDFRIDFTNNLAERRTANNKEKIKNSRLF